ncbi:hypothetical protein NESM_000587800 [Novymonas esmeraldas]|uniref:Uncharacterized protein n=1 Tax=Novymonas esmeraldas TaxID=1808958 RepID=A0AAW0EUP8_9TRYP
MLRTVHSGCQDIAAEEASERGWLSQEFTVLGCIAADQLGETASEVDVVQDPRLLAVLAELCLEEEDGRALLAREEKQWRKKQASAMVTSAPTKNSGGAASGVAKGSVRRGAVADGGMPTRGLSRSEGTAAALQRWVRSNR